MDNVTLFFLIFNLNGASNSLDKLMIFGSEYLIYLMIILMIVLSIRKGIKNKKALLLALLAIPISVLLIKAIHIFFVEQRPFVQYHLSPIIAQKTDASFPSRHATISAVIAFAYTYFKSKWAPLFLLLMLWVGSSRIFVGVHFPIDIIGGFVVAAISLAIALFLIKFLKLKHKLLFLN